MSTRSDYAHLHYYRSQFKEKNMDGMTFLGLEKTFVSGQFVLKMFIQKKDGVYESWAKEKKSSNIKMVHQNVKVPRKSFFCVKVLFYVFGSVVVVSLSEAPGFAVLCLVFPEWSGSAFTFLSKGGDDAFLELRFWLWWQIGWCGGRASLHLGQL